MKINLNEKDFRTLHVETERALKKREQFSDDSAWLKATLTRFCGACPEELDAQVTKLFSLCSAAADSLIDAKADSQKPDAELTQAQWAEIFSMADPLNPLRDEHARENITRVVDSMITSLSRTEREKQLCRLYVLTYGKALDPDELAAMSSYDMTNNLIRMTNTYVQNALADSNLLATLRFAHGHTEASDIECGEDKAQREAAVRALTAILASKPEYRRQLETGELKMEEIACAAYAAVESDVLTHALPETDWWEVFANGMLATAAAMCFAFLLWFALDMADMLVMAIIAPYAVMYGVGLGIFLKNILHELFPAGIMQTEAAYSARHAFAKLTTTGDNLLRDAQCAIMKQEAPAHKVVAEAPR